MGINYYRTPLAVMLATSKATLLESNSKTNNTTAKRIAITKGSKDLSTTLEDMIDETIGQQWSDSSHFRKDPQEQHLPKPIGALRSAFSSVEEIYIAGGGGAGRALPSALKEAVNFGLDLNKVKVVCATSVGAIMALTIAMNIPIHRVGKLLHDMPTDKFQDYSLLSMLNVFNTWGVCKGRFMEEYFKKMIKNITGLDDPTFIDLYRAGYTKDFRVITANVSKHKLAIFSYKNTPHRKIAQTVALACSVPFVFPPTWMMNAEGEMDAYTDGGIIKNYPWGIGSHHRTPLSKQLGFIFVNKRAALAINSDKEHSTLNSLWRYFCNILTMVIFQEPLCLSDKIKERTVAISVDHNPLNFNATMEEQYNLDLSGKTGVRRLVQHMVNNRIKKRKEKDQLTSPTLLHSYERHRERTKEKIRDEKNQYNKKRDLSTHRSHCRF